MRNYRIYLYTTLGFVLVYVLLIVFIIVPSVVKFQMTSLLQNEIDLSRQELLQVSVLSSESIAGGIAKENVLSSIQKAISGSENETIYLSVFDWSGKIVNYPDITKIGEKSVQKNNAILSNMESVITGIELYDYIINKKNESKAKNTSEIIALKPITESDLIIAAHLNIKSFNLQLNAYKNQMYTTFLVFGLLSLLLVLTIVRVLSIYYERIIEKKTAKFEDGVFSLSKLNASLETYQKSISELNETKEIKEERIAETIDDGELKELPKQRLLTYVRNELMPIAIEDISYLYVENTITYVVRRDGKRFTTNDSLDQIYSSLDEKLFFRANRKIEMKPVSEIDIVIGKNKTSAFKQWLDL